MKELDLPLLNHFLRLAMGGWDHLPVNDERQRLAILPLIKELDPEEKFWHVEGDMIWKIDPWREIEKITLLRREKREIEAQELEVRKITKDELTNAIKKKLGYMDNQQVEQLALCILRAENEEARHMLAAQFGIDLKQMELNKPHKIIQEGKVINEY
jgi:hypothetical protein